MAWTIAHEKYFFQVLKPTHQTLVRTIAQIQRMSAIQAPDMLVTHWNEQVAAAAKKAKVPVDSARFAHYTQLARLYSDREKMIEAYRDKCESCIFFHRGEDYYMAMAEPKTNEEYQALIEKEMIEPYCDKVPEILPNIFIECPLYTPKN